MTNGDRVKLLRDLDELRAGQIGTIHLEDSNRIIIDGVLTRVQNPWTIKGVKFDGEKYTALTRMVGKISVYVIDHCELI